MLKNLLTQIRSKQDQLTDLILVMTEGLWFRPLCWLVVSCALAFTLIAVEWNIADGSSSTWYILWESQPDGAQTMLGAIAGAILTVVSLAFSLMMVVVIQTANAYSPRLLQQFIADHHNHHVLGFMMGQFAYALVVLRSIQKSPEFVPHIAINVALLMSLFSIIALISFIHNVARSIQVSHIINLIEEQTQQLLKTNAQMYPGHNFHGEFELTNPVQFCAQESGYIRIIEHQTLRDILEHEQDVVVEFHRFIGDYVIKGSCIATVWRRDRRAEQDMAIDALKGGVNISHSRSWSADIKFGFEQLTDISLKALSPGINDPTTAMMAIRSLSKLYQLWCEASEEGYQRANEQGELRIIFPEHRLENMLLSTVWQIAHYGREDHLVMVELISTLGEVHRQLENKPHFKSILEETLKELTAQDVGETTWSARQKRNFTRRSHALELMHIKQ